MALMRERWRPMGSSLKRKTTRFLRVQPMEIVKMGAMSSSRCS
jgi:hypothetical protein